MRISELQASNPALFCTDKFSGHSYAAFYDELFAGKENAELNILEIGVYKGGSIRLMRDYMKSAHICGIDIVDRTGVNESNIPSWFYNMNLWTVNAYSPEYWDRIFKHGMFDVIIEDGSHEKSHQIYALQNFPAYLKPGGFLIIEDIPEGREEELIALAPDGGKCWIVNLRHIKGRWDDCLIVFKKD